MNEIIPYILAILVGIFTTLEATINSQLGKMVTPKIATLHSLIIGVLLFLIINITSGSLRQYSKVFYVKPYWLIGGVFGALIIYIVTKIVPFLGITITITLIMSAEVLSSFYIDTFVFKNQKIDLIKVFGALLILTGVYFISE